MVDISASEKKYVILGGSPLALSDLVIFNFEPQAHFGKQQQESVLFDWQPDRKHAKRQRVLLSALSRKLQKLNSTTYSVLKKSWDIPLTREFSFTISNATDDEIYSYTPLPNSDTNIFAREGRSYLLDQYGNRQKIKLRMNTW